MSVSVVVSVDERIMAKNGWVTWIEITTFEMATGTQRATTGPEDLQSDRRAIMIRLHTQRTAESL
jgi:hypothetical protein